MLAAGPFVASGGWPGAVELALIDAVLSIRSRYGGPWTGVRRRVERYRRHRLPQVPDDLAALAGLAPEDLAQVLETRQRTGGVLKAEAIVAAAQRLTGVGVTRAADLAPTSQQRAAYSSVRGLGPVTWAYLLMLVGQPGVERLVREAADRLGVPSSQLDHAIWRYRRGRA